jgi:hypothetical protein
MKIDAILNQSKKSKAIIIEVIVVPICLKTATKERFNAFAHLNSFEI